jgi:ABC-type sugar transport system ATPase subunit
MATIELREVYKQLDPPGPEMTAGPTAPFALEKLNLTIPHGKVVVVLGPSGCGKTTLLRLIAGLITPDRGQVLYNGRDMLNVPPGERNIGMVFQSYALYPQYNTKKNILSYFIFRKKTPEMQQLAEEKFRRTSELMGVEFEYLLNHKPSTLSGGEQQRVAIARCITREPALFLMDEPFANLDQHLRERYRVEVKRLLREFKVTTVYVTHDQREALALADYVALLNQGHLEQFGAPTELYHRPNSVFVAEFLNFNPNAPAINLFDGAILNPELAHKIIGVRPEDVEITPEETTDTLPARLCEIHPVPLKKSVVLTFDLHGHPLITEQELAHPPTIDETVWVRFKKYHLFIKVSGKNIRAPLNI